MSDRPVIGVTTANREVETAAGPSWSATASRTYLEAVWAAGGLPVLLPTLPPDAAEAALRNMDGVLLTGGGDVDPALYGAEPHPRTCDVDSTRDAFEVAVIRVAIGTGLPLLGICRGAQILNVALGGTLRQHLPDAGREHWNGFAPAHPVTLEPGSRLGALYGRDELQVNSLHHQALERFGEGLRAAAWSGDGVLEAVEHRDGWVIGVQWHPEFVPTRQDEGQVLFRGLVRRSAGVPEEPRIGAMP